METTDASTSMAGKRTIRADAYLRPCPFGLYSQLPVRSNERGGFRTVSVVPISTVIGFVIKTPLLFKNAKPDVVEENETLPAALLSLRTMPNNIVVEPSKYSINYRQVKGGFYIRLIIWTTCIDQQCTKFQLQIRLTYVARSMSLTRYHSNDQGEITGVLYTDPFTVIPLEKEPVQRKRAAEEYTRCPSPIVAKTVVHRAASPVPFSLHEMDDDGCPCSCVTPLRKRQAPNKAPLLLQQGTCSF